MKYEIELHEEEIQNLKRIRNYFGEHDKLLIEHTAYALLDKLVKNLTIPVVNVPLQREQLAKDILLALLQNSERYKYITSKVESGELKQEDANLKNINKAYKIADSFLSVGANEL